MRAEGVAASDAESCGVQVSQDGLVTCELVAGAVPQQNSEGGNVQTGPTRVSNMMMHVGFLVTSFV